MLVEFILALVVLSSCQKGSAQNQGSNTKHIIAEGLAGGGTSRKKLCKNA